VHKVIGVIGNKRKKGIGEIISDLNSWLRGKGIGLVVWDDLSDVVSGVEFAAIEDVGKKSDLVVALGGDGTLLRAARAAGSKPILGVNIGSLGFLTEVSTDEMKKVLNDVFAGNCGYEKRMNLHASVFRNDECVADYDALNDIVINKGALSRVIEMKVRIDGNYLATYTADGLIVSTPTGSTAYSLSAGGPIVNPCMAAIVATPICPHTLAIRPMILSGEQKLDVEINTGHSLFGEPEVTLTIDGQIGFRLASGDRIEFRKSDRVTVLVVSRQRSFYDVLREKLRWGDIRRNR